MKDTTFRVFTIVLFLASLCSPTSSPVHADEMTCPTHIPVSIDIKPGSFVNTINLSSQGMVPVAVLTTQEFDASQFTPEMAHLTDADTAMTNGCAGAMAERWTWDDVNGDGHMDLVFFFNIQNLNLTAISTSASLMAHGSYGSTILHIIGTDSVKIKP